MTINLLTKIYTKWCKNQKFDEFLSADEMLFSNQIKNPYQSYWLRRFFEIWNRCENINYKRYFKNK